MGCDIHLYFEKKNKKGTWEEIKIDERIIPDDRDYRLFSFLANVRNYDWEPPMQPQFADRHIPDDTSLPELDGNDYWLGDHSYTHAYLDEILKAPWEQAGLETCYFQIFCQEIIPRLCSFSGSLSDEEEKNIRVLIGFDN